MTNGIAGAVAKYDSVVAVIAILFGHDAHMDLLNGAGQTPAQVMGPQLWAAVLNELGYEVKDERIPRLGCLAARVVSSRVDYRGHLPAAVEKCVSLH